MREVERRLRLVTAELAEARATVLARSSDRVVVAHLDGQDAAFLLVVARRFQEIAPDAVALLTAGGPEAAVFAVAAGEKVTLDVVAVGRGVAEALGGRGGGTGRLFQG